MNRFDGCDASLTSVRRATNCLCLCLCLCLFLPSRKADRITSPSRWVILRSTLVASVPPCASFPRFPVLLRLVLHDLGYWSKSVRHSIGGNIETWKFYCQTDFGTYRCEWRVLIDKYRYLCGNSIFTSQCCLRYYGGPIRTDMRDRGKRAFLVRNWWFSAPATACWDADFLFRFINFRLNWTWNIDFVSIYFLDFDPILCLESVIQKSKLM